MNIVKTFLTGLSAATLFASFASAQLSVMTPPADKDRAGSNVIFVDGRDIAGFVAVTFSAPEWKDAYDKEGALDKFKGMGVRLGKNWWTKLDTTVAMEIGGKKLDAGAYVLGLHIGKDNEMHLVVIDAALATKHAMMPWDSSSWKNATHYPLKLEKNKLDKKHEKMEIAITADQKAPTKGEFTIRWGKHQLSAEVNYHVGMSAKDAGHEKNDKK